MYMMLDLKEGITKVILSSHGVSINANRYRYNRHVHKDEQTT